MNFQKHPNIEPKIMPVLAEQDLKWAIHYLIHLGQSNIFK